MPGGYPSARLAAAQAYIRGSKWRLDVTSWDDLLACRVDKIATLKQAG